MPLTDAIEPYLAQLLSERGAAERTVQAYREELFLLARFLDGRAVDAWAGASREHLLAYLNRATPRGRPLALASRNRKLSIIRGFLRHLISSEQLAGDPSEKIPWVKVTRTERTVLTGSDIRKIVGAIREGEGGWQEARDVAIVTLLAHTGMRISELLGLDLAQVDVESGLVMDLRRKGGNHQPLPLNIPAQEALQSWLGERDRLHFQGVNALFVSRRGGRLSRRAVESNIRALGERAGLPFRVTPHLLRHSFATELLRTGANLEQVRRLMGHSSILTTARYLHPDQASLKRAVAKLFGEEGREDGAPEKS